MTKHYRIADLIVAMDSFGRTVEQAEPYRIEIDESTVPDIEIKSNYESLKKTAPHLSDEDCEYLTSGGSFYRQLVRHNGMLIHSSAVLMDGRAYLFTAPCGTGKSTHTKLWMKAFGERAQILNDDKPAIRLTDGEWYAYGTPWSGKYDININTRAPLAGICVLGRGEVNKIERFSGAKAVHALLEQTARMNNPAFMGDMLALFDKLFASVPVWKMECNMDVSAAIMSHDAMSQNIPE